MKTIAKKDLIRIFHAKLAKAGQMKNKRVILASFGVESALQLSCNELEMLIKSLDSDADLWRKRVIAAIFGWCKNISYPADMATVKGIAARAAGWDRFNEIPVSRLRDIYYEFRRKNKTTETVQEFRRDMIETLKNQN
ncbi:MAG: hypothetical protein WC959_12395 [Kiritimatiellales bacterium]